MGWLGSTLWRQRALQGGTIRVEKLTIQIELRSMEIHFLSGTQELTLSNFNLAIKISEFPEYRI